MGNKRGRKPLIDQETFLNARNGACSVGEMIERLPELAEMDTKKAKTYVSTRLHAIRSSGVDVPEFRRGRKKLEDGTSMEEAPEEAMVAE